MRQVQDCAASSSSSPTRSWRATCRSPAGEDHTPIQLIELRPLFKGKPRDPKTRGHRAAVEMAGLFRTIFSYSHRIDPAKLKQEDGANHHRHHHHGPRSRRSPGRVRQRRCRGAITPGHEWSGGAAHRERPPGSRPTARGHDVLTPRGGLWLDTEETAGSPRAYETSSTHNRASARGPRLRPS